jgi:hypothetical protein
MKTRVQITNEIRRMPSKKLIELGDKLLLVYAGDPLGKRLIESNLSCDFSRIENSIIDCLVDQQRMKFLSNNK